MILEPEAITAETTLSDFVESWLAHYVGPRRRALTLRARQAGTRGWTELGLVFPLLNGRPTTGQRISRALERACRLARIEPAPTMHDLRHTYATRLRDGDVPLHDIQQALGHEHVATTILYLHQTPTRNRGLAAIAGAGLVDNESADSG